ncbi:FAD-dependent oxidoreductase [Candidatus Pacearchaeota archaeon]|nr:FAD-dependent oxidoreductase [Candidatus Pacearchaeota archaeon]
MDERFDFIIIGAGCTGLAAAMYGARLGMKTLCLGAMHGTELPVGGVITTTNIVENYPGFIRLSGSELAEALEKHARSYDLVDIREEKAEKIEKAGKGFFVKTKKNNYHGKAILFATGTKWRKLEVPGSAELENKGVAYCALCLHPDEEIISNSNIMKIKEVTPGTRVLTKEGRYQNIAGFTRIDYEGKIIKIRPRLFNESVSITAEHPVLTLKVNRGIGNNYWRDFKFEEPEWKKAEELTTDDCVLYPIIKEVEDKEFIKLSDFLELRKQNDSVIPHKKTHTAKVLNDKIYLTKDLMRLFGYYLAEGSASGHQLNFYFKENSSLFDYPSCRKTKRVN